MRLSRYFSAIMIAFTCVLFIGGSASAQRFEDSRACAGGCDRFGNSRFDAPRLPDESGLRPGFDHPGYSNPRYRRPGFGGSDFRGSRFRRSHRDFSVHHGRRYVGEPTYQHRESSRFRKRRRWHHSRRWRSRHHRRNSYYQPRYNNRTRFCRNHTEKRRYSFFHRERVNVERCVWVRNDLVPNYADRSYTVDRW